MNGRPRLLRGAVCGRHAHLLADAWRPVTLLFAPGLGKKSGVQDDSHHMRCRFDALRSRNRASVDEAQHRAHMAELAAAQARQELANVKARASAEVDEARQEAKAWCKRWTERDDAPLDTKRVQEAIRLAVECAAATAAAALATPLFLAFLVPSGTRCGIFFAASCALLTSSAPFLQGVFGTRRAC